MLSEITTLKAAAEEMGNLTIIECKLPQAVRGAAVLKGLNDYCILINELSDAETKNRTLKHELIHIINNDFYSDMKVSELENIRHIEQGY